MILLVIIFSFIPCGSSKITEISGKNIVNLVGMDYFALGFVGVMLIIGMTLFQIGADRSLTKVGEIMGSSLSNHGRLFIVVIFAFLLGALITVAEPSILIVCNQVNMSPVLLVGAIAAGVGIFVVFGVLRIWFHKSLKAWYIFFYLICFMLVCLIAIDNEARKYLPFIFDSGGITTGASTVPFILALGTGFALVRGQNSSEDGFGIVGLASVGPLITMALLILFNRSGFSDYVIKPITNFDNVGTVFGTYFSEMVPHGNGLGTILDVTIAIVPIIAMFFIYELIYIKLPKKELIGISVSFAFASIGLILFLAGTNSIMTPFGTKVGFDLGYFKSDITIVFIAALFGLVSILCEPAVHVLTKQVNIVSDGLIKKSTVLIFISVGVAIAIGLATMRSLLNFNILFIIVPGYLVALILMLICPNLFVAIGFDAGGTASGPMSVSFILPMVIGLTKTKNNYAASSTIYYEQSFGVVALIALIPILSLEILGIVMDLKKKYKLRLMVLNSLDPNDGQIIHFK